MVKVALVQAELIWEDPEANLQHFDQLLSVLEDDIDMVVLPEMFTSGFTMHAKKVAQSPDGEAIVWLKEKAKEYNAVFVASMATKENGNFYNRLYWTTPEETTTYDKRHLFRMANEQETYTMGTERIITTLKGINFCPLVCYDLRFPVWSRNVENGKSPIYDCLIYVANWPAARSDAWLSLLKARAIENQCYVIGVNRVGKDGNDIPYNGSSAAFSPRGHRMEDIPLYDETIAYVNLDLDDLNDFREKFPVGLDADNFEVK